MEAAARHARHKRGGGEGVAGKAHWPRVGNKQGRGRLLGGGRARQAYKEGWQEGQRQGKQGNKGRQAGGRAGLNAGHWQMGAKAGCVKGEVCLGQPVSP